MEMSLKLEFQLQNYTNMILYESIVIGPINRPFLRNTTTIDVMENLRMWHHKINF